MWCDVMLFDVICVPFSIYQPFSLDYDEKNLVFFRILNSFSINLNLKQIRQTIFKLQATSSSSPTRMALLFFEKECDPPIRNDVFTGLTLLISLELFFPILFFHSSQSVCFLHLQIEIGPQAQFSLQNEIVFILHVKWCVFFLRCCYRQISLITILKPKIK